MVSRNLAMRDCVNEMLRKLIRILIVKKHPEADSLYVESIDIGEEEPRTVCSGLVKYMTEDEIRGATIIVIVSSFLPIPSQSQSQSLFLSITENEDKN